MSISCRRCSWFWGVALLILLTACGSRGDPERGHAEAALDRHQRRVQELEERIARLGERIGRGEARGAYRGGGGLHIDGVPSDSLLDELHALRAELAQAREEMDEKLADLAAARRRIADAREQMAENERRMTILQDNTRQLAMAQDELWDRKRQQAELTAQLRTSEMQRLQIERALYDFSAELLLIRPMETDRIRSLQARMRDTMSEIVPLEDDEQAARRSRP